MSIHTVRSQALLTKQIVFINLKPRILMRYPIILVRLALPF